MGNKCRQGNAMAEKVTRFNYITKRRPRCRSSRASRLQVAASYLTAIVFKAWDFASSFFGSKTFNTPSS